MAALSYTVNATDFAGVLFSRRIEIYETILRSLSLHTAMEDLLQYSFVNPASYNASVFSELHTYEEASKFVITLRQPLEILLGLIKKHELEKYVGICLLHKHFDMASHEMLIEESGAYYSFMEPKVARNENVLPYMWKVSDGCGERCLYPLEFADFGNNQLKQGILALVGKKEFITEVCKTIAGFGLVNVIGITIRHREHITKADSTD